jgi:type II secretory pathway pseudopilin PulG
MKLNPNTLTLIVLLLAVLILGWMMRGDSQRRQEIRDSLREIRDSQKELRHSLDSVYGQAMEREKALQDQLNDARRHLDTLQGRIRKGQIRASDIIIEIEATKKDIEESIDKINQASLDTDL